MGREPCVGNFAVRGGAPRYKQGIVAYQLQKGMFNTGIMQLT
jgi:hypothetical protein